MIDQLIVLAVLAGIHVLREVWHQHRKDNDTDRHL